jgi:hypothetical protein
MPEIPAPQPAASQPQAANNSTPAVPASETPPQPARGSEIPWYLLAVAMGAFNGFVEVAVGDLLLTSFVALFFCMILGLLRPRRPWRWTVIVCSCIPLARLFAADVLHMYTVRAQIYEAFAAFITGNAGSYVGSLGRHRVDDLWKMIQAEKR